MRTKSWNGTKKINWKNNGMRTRSLEEILERKREEGGAWQVEASQKVPELVPNKRVSQYKKVEGSEGKKK